MSASPGRRWDTGAHVVAVAVDRAGRHAAAALGDGTVWLLDLAEAGGEPAVVPVHDGACLALARDIDDAGFLTGGDDGRLRRIAAGADPATLATAPGQWIEHIDTHPRTRLRAYNAGRRVHRLDDGGNPGGPVLEHPSTVGGLAFAPGGQRLAVAHYGGVSLWWLKSGGEPVRLDWKGSHLGVLWHPQGTHLMTTLQESGLHGWRLKDRAEMRMGGYPTKVRSMGWTAGARFLATGGADCAVCWPFTGGGPWSRPPVELAAGASRLVTVVAPHPTEPFLAAGCADGLVLLAPLDGSPPVAVTPAGGSPVTAMVWSDDGRHLLHGTEDGRLCHIPVPGRGARVSPPSA